MWMVVLTSIVPLNQDVDEFYSIDRESIMSEPHEYNVRTLLSTIDDETMGTITIPGFQRHYVWTKNQASRLVESIINGIPVPQIFFFAKDDKLMVIDGQQRLMTLYYFYKGKFPKKSFRTLQKAYKLNELPWNNKEYFEDFKLYLPARPGMPTNQLHGKLYKELERDDTLRFNRYAIKSVTITPNKNKGEEVVYEVFDRLNSGTTLGPQELRRCVYDSRFYEMLYKLNKNKKWRKMYGKGEQNKYMKDEESVLRGFALLESNYTAPMQRFLNTYSSTAKTFDAANVERRQDLFKSFLEKNGDLSLQRGNRFSQPLFDAVFVTSCTDAYKSGHTDALRISSKNLSKLEENETFTKVRTNTQDVKKRLKLAREMLIGGNEQA